MDRHVTMSLLETIVFSDIVEVISSDYNSSLHLHLDHCASQDSTSNGHASSEGALSVNVFTLNSVTRSFES